MNSSKEELKKSVVENYFNGALYRYNSIKKAFKELIDLLPEEIKNEKIQYQITKISQMFEQHDKKFYTEISEVLKHIK